MLRIDGISQALEFVHKNTRQSCRIALCMVVAMTAHPLIASTATTTSLTVSSSTAYSQEPVTLTATVMGHGHAINPGQVVFCNASAPHCEDLAILGTAQLLSDGTATIKTLLPVGVHSIYAKFLGTNGTPSYAASDSQADLKSVEVTGGQKPVAAQIFHSGTPGDSSLSATVDLGAAPGTGTISFLDVSDNHEIASAALDPATTTYGLDGGLFYPTASDALGVAEIGDFNRDGILDLVTPIDVSYNGNTLTAISFLAGNPAHPGHFLPEKNSLFPGTYPQNLVVADFNGDGVLDVAIADEDSSKGVIVSLGDAVNPGTFPTSTLYPLPRTGQPSGQNLEGRDICVGDFNGDGLPDIAVTNSVANTVAVLLNDPLHPGTFLAPNTFSGPKYAIPSSITTADFNGDGILDLAIGSYSNAEVYVYFGNPAVPGTFGGATSVFFNSFSSILSIIAKDFNGDGIPDLAVTSTGYIGPFLAVLISDPAHPGSFSTTYIDISSEYYNNDHPKLSAGDFNGDGILDIALAGNVPSSYDALTIYSGDPARPGNFINPVSYTATTAYAMGRSQADLNGDGLSDLVVGESAGTSGLSVKLGQRTETASTSGVNTGSTSYAYASYAGDSTYSAVSSCEIPLGAKAAAPLISNIYVSYITETSAAVAWTTNVPTYGVVQYAYANVNGTTYLDPVTLSTPWNDVESTEHFFVLPNLTPGTQYQYVISSSAYFSGCSHWTTTTKNSYRTFTTLP